MVFSLFFFNHVFKKKISLPVTMGRKRIANRRVQIPITFKEKKTSNK